MHELDATLRSRHTWGATTPYHLRPCFPTTPVFKSEVQHCGGVVVCGVGRFLLVLPGWGVSGVGCWSRWWSPGSLCRLWFRSRCV